MLERLASYDRRAVVFDKQSDGKENWSLVFVIGETSTAKGNISSIV